MKELITSMCTFQCKQFFRRLLLAAWSLNQSDRVEQLNGINDPIMQRNRRKEWEAPCTQVLRRSMPCQPEGRCCCELFRLAFFDSICYQKDSGFPPETVFSSSAFGLGRSQSHSCDWIWFFLYTDVFAVLFSVSCALRLGPIGKSTWFGIYPCGSKLVCASKCKTPLGDATFARISI